MDWLLEPFAYELSTWHPMAVHLPVVLLPLGLLGAIAYAATGRPAWRLGLLGWYAAAALAAWWAVETGERLYDEVEGTPIVDALIDQHEEPAEWALRLTAAVVVVLAGVTARGVWRQRRGPGGEVPSGAAETDGGDGASVPEPDARWARATVLALAAAAALLVAYAGHVGGIMVWGR